MAELFGRVTGCCQGKGGSMHIVDSKLGMLGANGIVGAGIAVATGAAFACQYRETDSVAVGFFGDGASNRGTFHEALNLAALWNLPVVYICENNHYAQFTRQECSMKVCDIAGRGAGYGIPGMTVDGNDIEQVYEAAERAVARARVGAGPSLVECTTWRHDAHYVGDPAPERDQGEHKAWLKKDPLTRCARELVKRGHATEAELERIREDARREMSEALSYAESSPLPPSSEALLDVFSS
jgi:TPP-dependent pyruvate/acetoin dehydrogenase alpha subunit